MNKTNLILKIIAVYSIWFLILSTIHIFNEWDNNWKAIILMALCLVFFWVILFWSLQFFFRKKIKLIANINLNNWKFFFIIFTIILALIEESIAVIMTNMVEYFWWEIWKAFITAHTNYFIVIFFHSIIIFIPMFFAWMYLLSKYDFKSNQVLLLFGITWVIAEITINPIALISWFWIYVYWLMIALPVYCLPERNVKKPKYYHYIYAIILPILFAIPFIPVIIFLNNFFSFESFI